MIFPDNILQCIDDLTRIYSSTVDTDCYFFANKIIVIPPIIEMIKMSKDKEMSLKLFYDFKRETFEIQAPTYKFYSTISHYDYNKTERRWSRDKKYIFELIKKLKICGLWNMVSNKDFFVVNSMNSKTDHRLLLKTLDELIN